MSWWRQLALFWHTLRHLRATQIYRRLWFHIWRPKVDLRPAPSLAQSSGVWVPPAERMPSMTNPRGWLVIGVSGQLDELGWDGLQREKLWRYNQHYFDDLNAKGAPDRQHWHSELLADWVAKNPPGIGTGWEPYPLSLRAVNLVKWALRGAALHPVVVQSLAVQIRWLAGRLEYHLLGNHLFANAKALVMSGLFFEGSEADTWLAKGLSILAREIPEQVLADGGHFERSTMYHALVLEDLLDLINATRRYSNRLSPAQRQQVARWHHQAYDMLGWLKAMCLGDGEISFFNDAAFDIAPSAAELEGYAHRLLISVPDTVPPPLIHLKDTGYLRITHGQALALLDVAPVGPAYLPGHAHADTLSFELSVGEQRVLVNSGISQYGSGKERLRQRGTSAHNTVAIQDQNSSEVWSGFRVARRANPFDLHIAQPSDASSTEIRCAHDGYTRLPGHPIHHRKWLMNASQLTVVDQIEGRYESAVARFHFHPETTFDPGSCMPEGAARLPGNILISWCVEQGSAHLEETTWHPSFSIVKSNKCLVVSLYESASIVHFQWDTWRIQ